MIPIAVNHPERWWLAIRRDVPLLSDPDLDDGRTRHPASSPPAWPSIAGALEKIGRKIIAGDYAVQEDDPIWVHVQADLSGLDQRDRQIVTMWFRGGATSPSADPGDESLNDGRHRLWAVWKARPEAVLPIYSSVLPYLDGVDLDTDEIAGSIIGEARRVLANSSPVVLERSPAYADETRRVAEHASAVPSDGAGQAAQDYLDRATVKIQFCEHPSQPLLGESWMIGAEVQGVSDLKAWLRREMREIAASDHGGCCGAGTYEMRSLGVDLEWGASASAFELVTTLRDNLMNDVTWNLLCLMAGRLSLKLEPLLHAPPDILDREVLVHSARTTAVVTQELDRDTLRVSACTLDGPHAGSVTLEDTTTGDTYTMETVAYRNNVRVTRLKSQTFAP